LLWNSIAGHVLLLAGLLFFKHGAGIIQRRTMSSPLHLWPWITLAMLFAFPLSAQQLKKVAVLELVNLDKNPNVDYLSGSMTEAMEEKLSSKFAYQKADKRQLSQVAEDNFLYKDDFATKSVALNLGLLAKQDVVIAGGFTVRKGNKGEELHTTVRIFDVPQKKVVAEIKEKSPIDNTIFESVDKITNKIVDAAKAVLPTKEEWQRGGGKAASRPWFNNWSLALAAGGGLYALDYADRIQAIPPALRFSLNANLPLIAERMALALAGVYLNDRPIAGKNPALEGLDVTTTTLMPGLWLGYRWERNKWAFGPRLGGGYALQSIKVTGLRNENLSNMMPFAGAAFDILFKVSSSLDVSLSWESAAQLQGGKTTLLNLAFLGLNFRL
ncbi:MAG: hypothetical protein N2Z22_07130, partial [Turneriella sp.]|nr:hypothetical protein [Turneriella sp.]